MSGRELPASLEDVLDITEYSGRTAINRLLFIASTVSTTELGRQALLTAIPIIKSSTLDTTTYTHAADLYIRNFVSPQRGAERSKPEVAAGNDRMDVDASVSLAKSPTSVMPSFGSNKVAGDANTRQEEAGMIDSTWLREASNQANVEKQKLDAELKQYLSNLIKESCRLTLLSIAAHQRKVGDSQGALKSYAKAREYNSNAQHELECAMGIIEVSLDIMAYSQTLPALVKAETSLDRIVGIRSLAQGQGRDTGIEHMTGAERMARNQKMKEMEEMRHTTLAKLKVAKGVAHLGVGNWEAAAREFMTVDGKLEDWEGKVFSPSDIAMYLSLTSLATLSRTTIKTSILDNNNLRYFLDYDSAGHAREMLSSFVEAKYATLMNLLAKHDLQHRLNPHLAPHVSGLTTAIRQRCLVQYFEPFTTVDLSRMAMAFNFTTDAAKQAMIGELAVLIDHGRLNARLDMIDMVLQAVSVDQRKALYKTVLQTGQDIDAASQRAHLRMQLIEAGVLVENPNQKRKPRKGHDEDHLHADDELAAFGGLSQEDQDIQMATAMSLSTMPPMSHE